ncbi:hypothetical protein FH972_024040 [Carpinus fangiana]|uniref:Zn(2)-C6 fungal-type domain-containing protein n=1 Tax=Carpinus fangiana TaxID=176857 RepID=A0A5N6KXD6_9ROSI|nr:hypothetical protein FH972_024040 [Carpinus fangiana]
MGVGLAGGPSASVLDPRCRLSGSWIAQESGSTLSQSQQKRQCSSGQSHGSRKSNAAAARKPYYFALEGLPDDGAVCNVVFSEAAAGDDAAIGDVGNVNDAYYVVVVVERALHLVMQLVRQDLAGMGAEEGRVQRDGALERHDEEHDASQPAMLSTYAIPTLHLQAGSGARVGNSASRDFEKCGCRNNVLPEEAGRLRQVNVAIHITCVPLILFTSFLLATNSPAVPLPSALTIPNLPLNLGTASALLYSTLYILMEPVAGGLVAPLLLGGTAYSNHLTSTYGATANYWAIALHVVSWVAQFVGHGIFEGRAPALLDNLVQALFLAPLFVWLEVLFALGYRPELKKRMDVSVRKELENVQKQKQQKVNGKTANGKAHLRSHAASISFGRTASRECAQKLDTSPVAGFNGEDEAQRRRSVLTPPPHPLRDDETVIGKLLHVSAPAQLGATSIPSVVAAALPQCALLFPLQSAIQPYPSHHHPPPPPAHSQFLLDAALICSAHAITASASSRDSISSSPTATLRGCRYELRVATWGPFSWTPGLGLTRQHQRPLDWRNHNVTIKAIQLEQSSHTLETVGSRHRRHAIRRNRVPLSCGPCRHRKLKCNRAHPCDNCTRRGDLQSCTYATPGNRKRNSSSGGSSSPDEMQNRIDRLENLVLSLMTNGGPPSAGPAAAAAQAALSASRSPTSMGTHPSHDFDQQDQDMDLKDGREEDSEVEQMSRSIGVMKVQNDRQFFASEAHWWAILSDIAEVKSYFAEHKKQYEEQVRKVAASKPGANAPGLAMFFKGVSKIEQHEILENFPQRPIANALIMRYFDTENPAARIVHRPTFKRQYEKHWSNPQATSIPWLGMCFAMMSLAMQSYHNAGDEPEELKGKSWHEALRYLDITAQCLVTSDFTQPTHFMIETLCLYMQAENNRSLDAQTGMWILSGIICRMALRMGLHRDPAPYAALSAYQGEMRRRIWTFIRCADTFLSFQTGLPGIVRSVDTDTSLPANVYDEEFTEDSKSIPQPRPLSEITPVSYMIAQSQYVLLLGKIMESTNALVPFQYDAVMALDAELQEASENVPQQLRLQSREDSTLDSASILMQRYMVNLLHNKCQLVLHRKFLSRARESSRFAYSRRTCVDAALAILAHQAVLHTECQPGGRLASVTWSSSSAMTLSDFLLAAMMLSLDLYHTAQAEASGQTSGEMYTWALERRETIFSALERAVTIWEALKDQSMEAYKASAVLRVMIEKLKNHAALRAQLSNNFSFQRSGGGVAPDGNVVAAEHSAAMTLGMMSTGGMTPNALSMFDRGYMGPRTGMTPQPPGSGGVVGNGGDAMGPVDAQNPFSNMFGAGMGGFQGMEMPGLNLDWDAWDTFVQGTGLEGGAFQGLTPGASGNMLFDPALTDATAPAPDNVKTVPTTQQSTPSFASGPATGSSTSGISPGSGPGDNGGARSTYPPYPPGM